MAGYLTTVAEVPEGNLAFTLAAIGVADILAHQFLIITKTIALSDLRSKIGIPCPSLSTGIFPPMSLCDHCEHAVPTRWHIGNTTNTADHLTSPLLDRCYTRYIARSPHRLTTKRGELVQHTLTTLQTQFQKQGAYVCWSCAQPILAARLLSKQSETPPSYNFSDISQPENLSTFIRHILLTSHPEKKIFENLLQTKPVFTLQYLAREHPLCDPKDRTTININNSLWVPYISTPKQQDPDNPHPLVPPPPSTPPHQPPPSPQQTTEEYVIWMYSVESIRQAHKAHPPKGKLTQTYITSYTGSRFKAFSIDEVEKAFENNTAIREHQDIDPILILDTTSLTSEQAYTITRNAIMTLRSHQTWKYDSEEFNSKVTLNLQHVRTLFVSAKTVKLLLRPLHTDKDANQPAHHNKAANFLIDIGLFAFKQNDSNVLPILFSTNHEPDFSGDIRPSHIITSQRKRIPKPTMNKVPFTWPDTRQPQRPLTTHDTPKTTQTLHTGDKRKISPPSINPWQFCDKCWKFNLHFADSCPRTLALPRPDSFTQELETLRVTHKLAWKRATKQKKRK
jgi:hypothetical protein